jgi:hypothetical protein
MGPAVLCSDNLVPLLSNIRTRRSAGFLVNVMASRPLVRHVDSCLNPFRCSASRKPGGRFATGRSVDCPKCHGTLTLVIGETVA